LELVSIHGGLDVIASEEREIAYAFIWQNQAAYGTYFR
jgi:hypothetical protein